MATEGSKDPKLPRFRKDLKIYEGPMEIDGSPTYNIYDPAKGAFFKISWKESLIFKCFIEDISAADLAKKVSGSFPIKVTKEDVNHFFSQAFILGLLRVPIEGDILYKKQLASKQNWLSWFIHYYLFLRIPVFHPDKFLAKTLPYVKFLGSKLMLSIYAVIIFTGFIMLVNRFDQFFNTFSYFFNIEGILFYACTVTFLKCIHELSHAYTAKNFGLYVPTMGIAFLVLWPVLYTDVTEGWKLKSRKQRFLISFAGIAAEFVMAGFATIGWIYSTPGTFQSLCFLVASTSWFSTIVININPAIRFDGYYILSDLWGIDNLMSRAFAYTRWQFHKTFLGMNVECPEENISTQRAAGFATYTVYTIIYRFFLYTAIALFVYYEFTKLIGIGLFAAEIWIFFLMPVVWEVSILYHHRTMIKPNLRSITTILAASLLAVWFIFPFPHSITLPGVIITQNKQIIYAPENGQIVDINIQNGQKVEPGTPLIQLKSAQLKAEIDEAEQNYQALKNELLLASSTHDTETFISQKKAQLEEYEQLKLGLIKRADKLNILSENYGTITSWNTLLKPGEYVHEGQIFGTISDTRKIEAIAFAQEKDFSFFKKGQKAKIVFQSSSLISMNAVVNSVDQKRVKELQFPSLASIFGGPLAVVPHRSSTNQGALLLVDSYYQLSLIVPEADQSINFGQSVQVKIRGPYRSYFFELLKYVYSAIFKESSF